MSHLLHATHEILFILLEYISGGLKDGIAKDATPTNMFFKAIRNLIERYVHSLPYIHTVYMCM